MQDDQHDPRHDERDQQPRVESREQAAELEPVAGFVGRPGMRWRDEGGGQAMGGS